MAIGKPNEAPFNALLRNFLESLDPAVKTVLNIPSMSHDSVANLAELAGADDLAAKRRTTAAEKRVEGAPDYSLEDLKKIVELASIVSPQGAMQSALPTAAAAAESAPKVPESLHYSVANLAKVMGAEELAGERMKDAERLRARRLGKDATAQEAMDQRIEEAMGDLGSTAKPAAKPELTLDEIEARDMAASAGAMPVDEEPAAPKAAKASEPVTRGDLDPDMQDMMGTTGVDPDDYDLAGGAKEPEVDYTDEAVGLFKNTHGTEFDPNSKMDREKLEKMRSMLESQGGLGKMSANQFALQVYRNS